MPGTFVAKCLSTGIRPFGESREPDRFEPKIFCVRCATNGNQYAIGFDRFLTFAFDDCTFSIGTRAGDFRVEFEIETLLREDPVSFLATSLSLPEKFGQGIRAP